MDPDDDNVYLSITASEINPYSSGVCTFFVIADEYGREKVKIPIESLRAFQNLINEKINQILEQYENDPNFPK